MKGSLNIPLDELLRNMQKIPKDRAIVTWCTNGGCRASAANTLADHRSDAHNGGQWTKVQAATTKVDRP